jgi:type IV pilus assembly protein PilW
MTYTSQITCSHRSHSRQAGFTLVEILVGLAIGMLATIVIMQVFSVFETQKRTTTGIADAQTNGSIALFSIGREMQQAGYGVMPTDTNESPYECPVLIVNGMVDATLPNQLSPAVITDTGGTDSITIRYGDSAFGGAPIIIKGMAGAKEVTVENNFGCSIRDTTLISPPINGTACAMSTVTALADLPTSPVLQSITLADATAAAQDSFLACLGMWHEVSYRVNGGNLERQELPISAAWLPSVAGIVDLQAQYGISAIPRSSIVTQWVDATGAWAAPSVANRNRIKAIRLALVARNDKVEPGIVTNACSSLTAANPTGLCAWEGSALSPAPAIAIAGADWQRYRYRVFETVLPIRNIIWSKNAL